MRNTDRIILKKIIGYCDDINTFLKQFGCSYDVFLSNKLLQYACNTCVVQIGELSTRLTEELKENHKEIPWRIIRATRNYHVHDYENITNDVVWQTLTEDIPELKASLAKILDEEPMDE